MVRALKNKYLKKKKSLLFKWMKPVFFVLPVALILVVTIIFYSQSHRSSAPTVVHSAAPVQLFTDVESGHPNFEAISYLKQHDMIEGYADGSFKPDGLVTRAELLKFLFEAQKIYPSPAVYRACFKDVRDEWFAAYVCYGKAKGLLEDFTKKSFAPGENINAADGLKIITKAFNHEFVQPDHGDAPLSRGQLAQAIYLFIK